MWDVFQQPGRRCADWHGKKVVPLAEGDAQSPQRALDPRPLGDVPTVSGEAPQKVQERMRGRALVAIRLDHAGVKS